MPLTLTDNDRAVILEEAAELLRGAVARHGPVSLGPSQAEVLLLTLQSARTTVDAAREDAAKAKAEATESRREAALELAARKDAETVNHNLKRHHAGELATLRDQHRAAQEGLRLDVQAALKRVDEAQALLNADTALAEMGRLRSALALSEEQHAKEQAKAIAAERELATLKQAQAAHRASYEGLPLAPEGA